MAIVSVIEKENKNLTIGSILVQAGRLDNESVISIIEHQKKYNIPFGEAGIQLKLLTREDVDFALAKQFDYGNEAELNTALSAELVSVHKPFAPINESLRHLRSQLILTWSKEYNDRRIISVVSAEKSAGKSFIVANLGAMFAQQGYKTLIIDANLRDPKQDQIFGFQRKEGLSVFLSGRSKDDLVLPVKGFKDLSVIPSGPVAPNPLELIGKPFFEVLLDHASNEFDIVIVDTPCADTFSDAELISSITGEALIVVQKNKTKMQNAKKLVGSLQSIGVSVVGSIINEF